MTYLNGKKQLQLKVHTFEVENILNTHGFRGIDFHEWWGKEVYLVQSFANTGEYYLLTSIAI